MTEKTLDMAQVLYIVLFFRPLRYLLVRAFTSRFLLQRRPVG